MSHLSLWQQEAGKKGSRVAAEVEGRLGILACHTTHACSAIPVTSNKCMLPPFLEHARLLDSWPHLDLAILRTGHQKLGVAAEVEGQHCPVVHHELFLRLVLQVLAQLPARMVPDLQRAIPMSEHDF